MEELLLQLIDLEGKVVCSLGKIIVFVSQDIYFLNQGFVVVASRATRISSDCESPDAFSLSCVKLLHLAQLRGATIGSLFGT